MKPKRIVNKKLIAAVKKLACVISIGCHLPMDVHHVTTTGAGGGDVEDNLMPLCRHHHRLLHSIGYGKAFVCYPAVWKWLADHNRFDIIDRTRRKS